MVSAVNSSSEPIPTNFDQKMKTITKEDFLKLLITQLEHQDPLAPMGSPEFMSQITQLTSLEELRDVNKNLESSQGISRGISDNLAASFIGKAGKFNSEVVEVTNGKASEIHYKIPQAANVDVNIYDSYNNLVRSLRPGVQMAGDNIIYWDGKNNDGKDVMDGSYQYKITARNSKGQELIVDSVINARITGVSFEGGQTLLKIGSQHVPFSSILELNEIA